MMFVFVSFPMAFLLFKRKHIWLISEINFDARDNGLHFFKYLNLYHREINSCFIISKKNPNFNIIKTIGKTIEPHSYLHYLIFIAADYKISTLVHGCSPNSYLTKYLLKHHFTGKNIALKHGIFKNKHPNYFKENAHLDMICCGSKPEFDYINANFHYSDGVAQYTGLARFDALHDKNIKNLIFIMPTWRRWLSRIEDFKIFSESEYFLQWFGLLSNIDFLKILNDKRYKIVFYVHPNLNKYYNLFSSLSSNVCFLNSNHGDSIQKYLREANILITDYSSVFYDFAYQKKPSIYFQFDEKRYFEEHYEKSFFDYRRDGFGKVCNTDIEVISELNKLLENNCKIEDEYLKRIHECFPLNDNKNCDRIFQGIIKC